VKILTGNDLKSGAVTWWTGQGWSLRVEDAADAGDAADAIAATENAARRVVSPYVIDGEVVNGTPRPAHIKDRIRALGPTVRLDLTLKPGDAQAAQQVI
jgi:hypothetical protein